MTLTLTKPQIDYAIVATKLSALLGRKWGVNVVFGAHPATNGKTIYLPHWNFDEPKLIPALYGLIAHEAGGHVRMTDFKLLQSVSAARHKEPDFALFKSFENLLEDIRIEVNLLRLYPGARLYLNAAVEYMLCRNWTSAHDCTDFWDLAFRWCLLEFRFRFLGQSCLQEQVEDVRSAFRPVVGDDCMAQAVQICADVAALGGSLAEFQNVLVAADRLKDLMMGARPSQQQGSSGAQGGQQASDSGSGAQGGQQAPDSGSGAQGGQQTSDSGSGAQGGQQASDSGSGAQGGQQTSDGGSGAQGGQQTSDSGSGAQGGQQAPDGGSGAQGGQQASDGGSGAQGGQQASDGGSGAQGGQQASDGGSGAQGGQQASDGGSGAQGGQQISDKPRQPLSEALPSNPSLDVFGDLARAAAHPEFGESKRGGRAIPAIEGTPATSSEVLGHAGIAALWQSATPLIQGLFTAVAPMLTGEMDYEVSLRSGNKLDGRRIARAVSEANPAIFRRVSVEDDQSVAVQVLVDRSKSTQGTTLAEEIKAAIGLTSALERFPEVETAVSFFPGANSRTDATSGAHLVKDFGEPMRATLKRWPEADGGTPLHTAYFSAGFHFFRSKKERRVLIVLTDGKPTRVPDAIEAKRFLKQLGVEVYGIVIGNVSAYPADVFDDSELAGDAAAVQAALRKLVTRIL